MKKSVEVVFDVRQNEVCYIVGGREGGGVVDIVIYLLLSGDIAWQYCSRCRWRYLIMLKFKALANCFGV